MKLIGYMYLLAGLSKGMYLLAGLSKGMQKYYSSLAPEM